MINNQTSRDWPDVMAAAIEEEVALSALLLGITEMAYIGGEAVSDTGSEELFSGAYDLNLAQVHYWHGQELSRGFYPVSHLITQMKMAYWLVLERYMVISGNWPEDDKLRISHYETRRQVAVRQLQAAIHIMAELASKHASLLARIRDQRERQKAEIFAAEHMNVTVSLLELQERVRTAISIDSHLAVSMTEESAEWREWKQEVNQWLEQCYDTSFRQESIAGTYFHLLRQARFYLHVPDQELRQDSAAYSRQNPKPILFTGKEAGKKRK